MLLNHTIDENTIYNILTCDPITRKGKEALGALGLSVDEVTPTFFYDKVRVKSQFEKEERGKAIPKIEEALYYEYSVDMERFKEAKGRLLEFNRRFQSDSTNESILLMIGVAGNGKTIEVNRRIREVTSGDSAFECCRAYIDLEESFEKLTYGVTYHSPDNANPLWLCCINLLDGILHYIKHCNARWNSISTNYNRYIIANNLADDAQKQIFQIISQFTNGNNEIETKLFSSIIGLLTSTDAKKDIKTLLEMLMYIMFCSEPERKHYIVFDNIEQYIKLNSSNIQIPNSAISTIYESITETMSNIVHAFDRIRPDLAWKVFKIIIVVRRTSLGLLDPTLLHTAAQARKNVEDFTGHYPLPSIWWERRKYIWTELLINSFDKTEENSRLMELVDRIMKDDDSKVGMNYQSIIAPLMSYGIRRNARAQAHAAYRTFEVLFKNSDQTIDFTQFDELMKNAGHANFSIQYMFRRMLLEWQFKWSISDGNNRRWSELGIGHLAKQSECRLDGRRVVIENVKYYSDNCVSLMRRILTCLSYYSDDNPATSQYKPIVDMFSTISLYHLIRGVLVNPLNEVDLSGDNFAQFARVLIALSDMSNGDTRSAPFVILNIKNSNFHKNTSASVLAELLKKIWNAGETESGDGKEYNKCDYGVRITDAGYAFLLDWQPSFSFMAALYCYTIPSLFFLKDVVSIKYVIKTVYTEANGLCRKYESEADSFCGKNITIQYKTYLPKISGEYVTFRMRVKDLHIKHLILYREYLRINGQTLGIPEKDIKDLCDNFGYINRYIAQYKSWETEGDAKNCF